jgi:hypothetical protein
MYLAKDHFPQLFCLISSILMLCAGLWAAMNTRRFISLSLVWLPFALVARLSEPAYLLPLKIAGVVVFITGMVLFIFSEYHFHY